MDRASALSVVEEVKMEKQKKISFIEKIEHALGEIRRANIGTSTRLAVVRRLNNPEMILFARPVLWRENVHGLGFGRADFSGSFDPAFKLEVWVCRHRAGYHYQGPCRVVETTRAAWSRHIKIVYSLSEASPFICSQEEFDLRHQRDRAREEILRCAAMIADFWQNKGAVALLKMPDLHLSLWKDEREHQRYIVARVQDKRGNYADTVWCAPTAKAKDEDVLIGEIRDSLVRYFDQDLREFNELEFTITCLGGGSLDVDYDKGKIVISGQSEKYGKEPDRKGTHFLIEKMWYPGYDVKIKD